MSLTKKLKEYTKKQKELYLPYLWKEWGVEPEHLTNALVSIWDTFPNPRVYENLLQINYKGEEPRYYETCDTKYKRGNSLDAKNIERYAYYNQEEDQHISVFKHDEKWKNNYKKTGSVSCRNTLVSPDFIYLELDRPSLKKSVIDAQRIYDNFPYPSALTFWYSGNTSVHVGVNADIFGNPIAQQGNVCGIGKLFYNLAHKSAGDCRHNNEVADPWLMPEPDLFKAYYKTTGKVARSQQLQEVRQKMENIDPNLFRVNSLIRQPWSYHEKGEKQKVMLDFSHNDSKEIQDVSPHILDIDKIFPYLLHYTFECYESKYQENKSYEIDIDADAIVKAFSEIEGFDPEDVGKTGWINELFSPFYEDTNPSVSVNVESGYYQDFGEPTHSFDVYTFYAKLKNISKEKAKKILNDE